MRSTLLSQVDVRDPESLARVRAEVQAGLEQETENVTRFVDSFLHGVDVGLNILSEPQNLPDRIQRRLTEALANAEEEAEASSSSSTPGSGLAQTQLPPGKLPTLQQLVLVRDRYRTVLASSARLRALPRRAKAVEQQLRSAFASDFHDATSGSSSAYRDHDDDRYRDDGAAPSPRRVLNVFQKAVECAAEATDLARSVVGSTRGGGPAGPSGFGSKASTAGAEMIAAAAAAAADLASAARVERLLDSIAAQMHSLWTTFVELAERAVRVPDPDLALMVALAQCAVLHDRALQCVAVQEGGGGRGASALEDALWGLVAIGLRFRKAQGPRDSTASPAHRSPAVSAGFSPSRPIDLGGLYLGEDNPFFTSPSPTGPGEVAASPAGPGTSTSTAAGAGPGSPSSPTAPDRFPPKMTSVGLGLTFPVNDDPAEPSIDFDDVQVPEREAMLEWISERFVRNAVGRFEAFVRRGRVASLADGLDKMEALLSDLGVFAVSASRCFPPRVVLEARIRAGVLESYLAFLTALLEAQILGGSPALTSTTEGDQDQVGPHPSPMIGPSQLALLLAWSSLLNEFRPGSGDLHLFEGTLIRLYLDHALDTSGALARVYRLSLRSDLTGPAALDLQQTARGTLWSRGCRDFLHAIQEHISAARETQNLRLAQAVLGAAGQGLVRFGRDVESFFATGASVSGALEAPLEKAPPAVDVAAAGRSAAVPGGSDRALMANNTAAAAAAVHVLPGQSQLPEPPAAGASASTGLRRSWRRLLRSREAGEWGTEDGLPPILEPRGDRVDRCCAALNNARTAMAEVEKILQTARDDPEIGGDPAAVDLLSQAWRAWRAAALSARTQLVGLILSDARGLFQEIGSGRYWADREGRRILQCLEAPLRDYMADLSRFLECSSSESESKSESDGLGLEAVALAIAEGALAAYIRQLLRTEVSSESIVEPLIGDMSLWRTEILRESLSLSPALSAPLLELLTDIEALLVAPTPATLGNLWNALVGEKYGRLLFPVGRALQLGTAKRTGWKKKEVEAALSVDIGLLISSPSGGGQGPGGLGGESGLVRKVPESVERVLELVF